MTRTTDRRLVAAIALGLALAAGPSMAQNYPSQTVKIVVPFAAGGGGDTLGRILAEKLAPVMGQPVIVENKPGASTIIGTESVVKSEADGHTILLNVPNIVMTKFMTEKLPYEPLTDLVPVIEIVKAQLFLGVSTQKTQAKTLKEFIDEAKAKPGQFFYGSVGPGSVGHLLGYSFAETAGLKMDHVPYRGGGPAAAALAGGEIASAVMDFVVLKPQVDAGRVRLLAATGTKRSANAPDVPTFAESGLGNFNVYSWAGLFVPARTPAPVVSKITADVARVLKDPDVISRFQRIGYDVGTLEGKAFADVVKADHDSWGALITKVGVKLN